MKYAKWTPAIFVLLLAASAVWAECPTCVVQPVQVQCPTPCPAPCPQACPSPCPCPASVPAAIGAGPAVGVQGIQCPDFDAAYAGSMYAQNSVIIGVTAYGMQNVRDHNLRDISGEINGYLTSANSKLQGWYGATTCGTASPDCAKAQEIIAQLSSERCGPCFDAVYARTLSELLKQSQAADTLGGQRAVTPQMRDQAQFLSRREADWAFRLDRWVSEHPQGA